MSLEEIIDFLKKYQNKYWFPQTAEEINKSIQEIYNVLKDVKTYLSNELYEINSSDIIEDDHAHEILNDIQALKEKIKIIKNSKLSILPINGQAIDETILFDKMVNIFLVSDEICPPCNYKISPHKIYYNRIIDNKLKQEDVIWHICEACGRLFVLDYETEEFDFSNTNIVLNKDFYDVIPDIDIHSIIVLKNTLPCSTQHRTKDLTAKIPILDKNCESHYVEIRASYCFDCKHFTILKDDFDKISDIVTCKVIDETTIYKSGESEQNQEQDNDISILKFYGYNVQTKKNMSEQQRHIILSSIIEAGIMNRRQVIDLIETNMKRKSTRPDCALAIQKWKNDIEFVKTYKTESLPEVVFDKIVLKYRNKV